MIKTLEIKCNAAYPDMPLMPFVAFKSSPSSVRIMDVPKKIGNWNITEIIVKVQYPDNSYSTKTCVRNGNVWVGTLDGTDTPGTVQNGFMIGANGVDENGEPVSGYILGVGDVRILDADTSFHPGVKTDLIRLLDSVPDNPTRGDAYFSNTRELFIWESNAWQKITSSIVPSTENPEYAQTAEVANAAANDLYGRAIVSFYATKAELSAAIGEVLTQERF